MTSNKTKPQSVATLTKKKHKFDIKTRADPQLSVPEPTITYLLSIVDFGQVKKCYHKEPVRSDQKKICIVTNIYLKNIKKLQKVKIGSLFPLNAPS